MKLLVKLKRLNLPTKVTMIISTIIIIVGIYFSVLDLTTTGLTMGESGESYGTGTIDGNGIVFCGLILLVIGLVTFNAKMHKDPD